MRLLPGTYFILMFIFYCTSCRHVFLLMNQSRLKCSKSERKSPTSRQWLWLSDTHQCHSRQWRMCDVNRFFCLDDPLFSPRCVKLPPPRPIYIYIYSQSQSLNLGCKLYSTLSVNALILKLTFNCRLFLDIINTQGEK